MDDNNNPKDQNVVSFMMQLIQEKHGDETDLTFLNSESDRLYDLFGDNLVNYFEPQLNEEQKIEFDNMISQNVSQDALMDFLLKSIPDLEAQIMDVLVQFRQEYLDGKLDN